MPLFLKVQEQNVIYGDNNRIFDNFSRVMFGVSNFLFMNPDLSIKPCSL